MRLGVVEGLWALEGWAARVVARLVLIIVLMLAAALVVGAVWWAYTRVMADREAVAVERRWAEAGLPIEAILERHPPRTANASAVRLEELARPLGIDLVPRSAADRTRPDDTATAQLEAIADELTAYAQTLGKSDRLVTEPPAAEVAVYLERHQGVIDTVVDHLLHEKPPQWECDLTKAMDAPLPNLLGQLRLTRVLVARSALHARIGRIEESQQALEAGWQLQLVAARRPEYLSQLVAAVEANMIAGAVRNHTAPPASWADLLLSFDARQPMLEAIQLDAWTTLEAARRGSLFGADNAFARAFAPAVQRGLAKCSEALRSAVLTMPRTPFADFDPGEGYSVTLETALPVSMTGRIALTDAWQGWAQVGRSMLCRELAAEVVRLRHRGRSTDTEGEPTVPREQVSAVFPSVSWRFASNRAGVSIEPSQPLPAVPPKAGRSLCSSWYEEMPRGH